MKKLTIITINFNHLDGLKRTIDSIENQTFKDYEWIVVDGGSTDGSKELLEHNKDKLAWWCSEPDKGVYNAMNKGITHATGEWILFVNSGDFLASTTVLEEVLSKSYDSDILYGQMTRGSIYGRVNNISMMRPNLHWWDFYNSTFNHQATFIKAELFDKYGLYDESYRALGDWRHFAELFCIKKVSCEYLPIVIAVYEGGGISEKEQVWRGEVERIHKELFPMVSQPEVTELIYLNRCNQYRLSKRLYFLVTRGTNRIIKFIKKIRRK